MFSQDQLTKLKYIALGASIQYISQQLQTIYKNKKIQNKQLIEEVQNFQQVIQNEIIDYTSEEYQKILNEQYVRNIQFFGEQSQKQIQNSYVIVFGVGGVGSHCVSSLIRSGISHIKIVDFDRVTLSSLNRHAFATREDVGRSKVECMKDYIQRICPHCKVDIAEEYVTKDNVSKFFDENQQEDYVVDCIDNIDAKVALLAYCKQNNKKVISSMGAGMKADPTRIQIRDISETTYDDLSRAVRTKLKKYGIQNGIKVILSVEKCTRELLPLQKHQEGKTDEFKVFSNYRLRIVPVLGTMPAIFGLAISSYILCELAGQLYNPFTIDDVKQTNYAQTYDKLHQEAKNAKKEYLVDISDVYVLLREVYEWKDIINQKKQGNLLLVRWNPEKEFVGDNITVMNPQDVKKHLELKTYEQVQNYYNKEVLQRFEDKQQQFIQYWKENKIVYK